MAADVRSMARELANVLDVCGWDISAFSVDVLNGTLKICAKEKTAEAPTSNGQV